MQLRDWQNNFQHGILTGVDDLHIALRSDNTGTDNISGSERLNIYKNAYSSRLREALHTNFPALHQLLGDDDFNVTAQQFLQAHPPSTASIRWFGEELSSYLAATKPFSDCPAIAELAAFEWALRHCVDAADAVRIGALQLQAVDAACWENLVFDLHPSLSILSLQWNAPQIWKSLSSDDEPPPPQRIDRHWLVYRQADLVTAWRSADANEVSALHMLQAGSNFAEVCEYIAQQLMDSHAAAMHAATLLRIWVEQGLLIERGGPQ